MSLQVQKKMFVIHPYDQGIASLHRLIQTNLSKKNIELILKYDKEMVKNSLAKATRRKHLEVILMQSRMLNKDWDSVTREDIDDLVYQIIQKYSPDSGQETNSTWDHKKILKIFFRRLKFGSREYRHVGDPDETKFIRLKPVKSKIVREHLITKEDFEKLTRGCNRPCCLIDSANSLTLSKFDRNCSYI
ncbi:MAG: hypothetical protein O6761_01805 [Thaumarchaeota archaeon]|nr:hypothetical protein [Nitrososphaerota archaeon]